MIEFYIIFERDGTNFGCVCDHTKKSKGKGISSYKVKTLTFYNTFPEDTSHSKGETIIVEPSEIIDIANDLTQLKECYLELIDASK